MRRSAAELSNPFDGYDAHRENTERYGREDRDTETELAEREAGDVIDKLERLLGEVSNGAEGVPFS